MCVYSREENMFDKKNTAMTASSWRMLLCPFSDERDRIRSSIVFLAILPFLSESYMELDGVEEMGGANSSHWTLCTDRG